DLAGASVAAFPTVACAPGRGAAAARVPGAEPGVHRLGRPGAGHDHDPPGGDAPGGLDPGLVVRRGLPDRCAVLDGATDRAGCAVARLGVRRAVGAVGDRDVAAAAVAGVVAAGSRRAGRGAELLDGRRAGALLAGARRP